MKLAPDSTEIARKLRNHIRDVSKISGPPPVQLSIYDGSRQFLDGYVWAFYGDKRVQCITPGPVDYTSATMASQIVIWALPSNQDESSGAYFCLGYVIGANTNNRIPSVVATSYSVGGASATPTYSITNVTTDRSYDANATTTDELADVLGTLIADLKALKIIN